MQPTDEFWEKEAKLETSLLIAFKEKKIDFQRRWFWAVSKKSVLVHGEVAKMASGPDKKTILLLPLQ